MKPEPNAQRELRLVGRGDFSSREYRLGTARTSVGSDRGNDLVVDHPTVSARHAIVRKSNGRYTIGDLDSTNGTFVNGRRITQTVPIGPGDEISFGAAKFALTEAAAAPQPAKPPRSSWRKLGAAGGIILFALTGFLFTRYVLNLGRTQRGEVESRPGKRTPPAQREEAESSAEPSSAATSADLSEGENYSPLWLKQLNDFRASVNLAPAESDPKLSEGDRKHAIYAVKNFGNDIRAGSLGLEVHSEDPTNQWYTVEGEVAARSSDIAWQGSNSSRKLPDPQGWAIEGWMVAPFHRFPIISPLLQAAGFGFYCEENTCVAVLNVESATAPMPSMAAPMEHPILYPPDGGFIPASMRSLENEFPSPLSGCNGYVFPAGLPMSVQLGPMVDAQLNSFSITREDGVPIEACGFDASSYYNPDESQRSSAISNLRSQGAVIIVPRHPLDAGTRYDVVATVNGHDYKWSFSTDRSTERSTDHSTER
jgi:hypothetical protein